jgi:hypothetical protein
MTCVVAATRFFNAEKSERLLTVVAYEVVSECLGSINHACR